MARLGALYSFIDLSFFSPGQLNRNLIFPTGSPSRVAARVAVAIVAELRVLQLPQAVMVVAAALMIITPATMRQAAAATVAVAVAVAAVQHVFFSACSFRCLWPNILADFVVGQAWLGF